MISRDEGLSRQLVAVCRALYQRQLVAALDGNVSARQGQYFLTTTSGVSKGFLQVEDLVLVDPDGRVIAGRGRPTSELLLHLEVYRQRPEAGAVIHAHPPVATACTIADVSLTEGILPEVVLTLGGIPTAPYATTGTPAMAAAIRDLVQCHDAILLEQHGALTVGRDLWDAYYKMEKVEHAAWTVWLAKQLGQARPLPPAEVAKLTALGIAKGYRPPAAGQLQDVV
ncbi:MAG: class II aldolase/adducin family protein [Desulfobacca sp.]|uniref:class II aldolase/adducin family protein n=1 Tax=Desulfobacca sp. TaxID=2067990 RepID=UPI00404AEE24